jgi:hypothetical protein
MLVWKSGMDEARMVTPSGLGRKVVSAGNLAELREMNVNYVL